MFLFKVCYLYKNLTKNMSNTKNVYYQYKYNSKIEELVNKQIHAEQQAAQEYLNIAVTFLHPSKNFIGAGGFFMHMHKEELQHMHKFIHYQILRGGQPLIAGVQPPVKNENLTLIDAFKQGLDMEKQITEQLEDFIKVAEDVKDYHCLDVLTSVFLSEQIKSIYEMASHVTKLSWLNNDEQSLYHYDLKLAKKYPYQCPSFIAR